MIIKEYYRTRKDGVKLYRSYSDEKLKIVKLGTDEIYDEAIDVENAPYEYAETEMPIEPIDTLDRDGSLETEV
jgi:hypothetical protein